MRGLLLVTIVCSGCASVDRNVSRTIPEAAAALRGARRVALLVDAKAQTGALGGVPLHSPERTADLRAQVVEATQAALTRRGLETVLVEPEGEAQQVSLLFLTVVQAAYGPPQGAAQPFHHGLGTLERLVDPISADLLLVAWARIHVEDLDGFIKPAGDLTILFGLCDRKGRLLWLSQVGKRAEVKVERQRRTVEPLVGLLMDDLPGGP